MNNLTRTILYRTAYGRHWISWPMRIVSPLPWRKNKLNGRIQTNMANLWLNRPSWANSMKTHTHTHKDYQFKPEGPKNLGEALRRIEKKACVGGSITNYRFKLKYFNTLHTASAVFSPAVNITWRLSLAFRASTAKKLSLTDSDERKVKLSLQSWKSGLFFFFFFFLKG